VADVAIPRRQIPHDTTRRLVSEGGADGLFWIHVAQAIVFTALTTLSFVELASVAARDGR
jgi:hypothetical protein